MALPSFTSSESSYSRIDQRLLKPGHSTPTRVTRCLLLLQCHSSAKKWCLTLILLTTSVIFVLAHRAMLLYKARQQGIRIRSSQSVKGLGQARRLRRFDEDVSEDKGAAGMNRLDRLFAHPLLTETPTLNCSMTSHHRQRYSSFLAKEESSRLADFSSLRNRFERDPVDFRQLTYLIAINLIDVESVLPSMIRAIVSMIELTTTLKKGQSSRREESDRYHITIYENGSTDRTPSQLLLLSEILQELGVGYTIISNAAERTTSVGNRVEELARLRNKVLQPMFNAPSATFDRVLFINDVHLCEVDILEMMYGHEMQDADMSCGMDYDVLDMDEPFYLTRPRPQPLKFYDTWVARDIQGEVFYEMRPATLSYEDPPHAAFGNSPSLPRYNALLPIQVYSCWNGIALFRASLFDALIPSFGLRFRALEGTDSDSECFLICKDIWRALTPQWEWVKVPRKNWLSLATRKRVPLVRHDASPMSEEGLGNGTTRSSNDVLRGARIMVNPRVAVAYAPYIYERARQDQNDALFQAVSSMGTTIEEQRAEIGKREKIDWQILPPNQVVTYKYSDWDHMTKLDTLS